MIKFWGKVLAGRPIETFGIKSVIPYLSLNDEAC